MHYTAQHLKAPCLTKEEEELYCRANDETRLIRDYFKCMGFEGLPLDIERFTVTIIRMNESKV